MSKLLLNYYFAASAIPAYEWAAMENLLKVYTLIASLSLIQLPLVCFQFHGWVHISKFFEKSFFSSIQNCYYKKNYSLPTGPATHLWSVSGHMSSCFLNSLFTPQAFLTQHELAFFKGFPACVIEVNHQCSCHPCSLWWLNNLANLWRSFTWVNMSVDVAVKFWFPREMKFCIDTDSHTGFQSTKLAQWISQDCYGVSFLNFVANNLLYLQISLITSSSLNDWRGHSSFS